MDVDDLEDFEDFYEVEYAAASPESRARIDAFERYYREAMRAAVGKAQA